VTGYTMPRAKPPHVHPQITRHGRRVWYFRRRHGPRTRLPCGPGEPGFDEAYLAALTGETPPKRVRTSAAAGTMAWLIDRYRETDDWRAAKPLTRRTYELAFRAVIERAGTRPVGQFTPAVIRLGVESRKPGVGAAYLKAMRRLFRWAVAAKLAAGDPTAGIKARTAPRTGGFAAWTAEDIEAFSARWPLGTRERVAFDVLRYTGLRREDACLLGRQHVRDGVIRTTATKGKSVRVTIAMHPELAATLAAGPTGEMRFIACRNGQPMTKDTFSRWFYDACRAAGVAKSAHGLRKSLASSAAEAGATSAELAAQFGWRDHRMPALYTESADRERLGLAGSRRVIPGTPCPSPTQPGEGSAVERAEKTKRRKTV
jgi:integrase